MYRWRAQISFFPIPVILIAYSAFANKANEISIFPARLVITYDGFGRSLYFAILLSAIPWAHPIVT